MCGFPIMSISINKTQIILNSNDVQLSKKGRPMRKVGIRMNLQMPSKWINKSEKWHWIYRFIYLDEQAGGIEVEIDYNDQFYQLLQFC